ncbi:MAG: hypothetical protein MI700_06150 [Balneolales bacterium]|nr:hypothetical protein [Balneolales bacterium]
MSFEGEGKLRRIFSHLANYVIPAKAGIWICNSVSFFNLIQIPASAGMTKKNGSSKEHQKMKTLVMVASGTGTTTLASKVASD